MNILFNLKRAINRLFALCCSDLRWFDKLANNWCESISVFLVVDCETLYQLHTLYIPTFCSDLQAKCLLFVSSGLSIFCDSPQVKGLVSLCFFKMRQCLLCFTFPRGYYEISFFLIYKIL